MTRRTIRTILALLATAALFVGILAAPAEAATGRVKGVVSLSGTPLPGARVTLQSTESGDSWDDEKTATTSSTGSYSFSGYVLGSEHSYRVKVHDPQHRAVTTVRSFNDSTTKTVTRNVTMTPGAVITGKVTRADGASAAGTEVFIDGPDINVGGAGQEILAYDDRVTAKADGTYRLPALPKGSYTVAYFDTTQTYVSECYDDLAVLQESHEFPEDSCTDYYSEDYAYGKTVTVATGATATVPDQQLDKLAGRIRGTVTDTSGNPLDYIVARAVPVGADRSFIEQLTRSTGRFNLAPVPEGEWQLRFDDPGTTWEGRWLDSTERDQATELTVTPGGLVKGLVVELKSRARLTVKATPGTGRATFTISVVRAATGSRPSGKVTVSRGDVSRTVSVTKGAAKVTLTGLSAGRQTFKVRYQGTRSTADAAKNVTTTIR